MKRILLIIFQFLFTAALIAQENQNEKNEHKWGLSVAINSVDAQIGDPERTSWGFEPLYISDKVEKSFSFSIIPKYFIRGDILLRVEFGLTNLDFTYNQDYKDINHTITNQSAQQKIYRCLPSIQWNFMQKNNIEFNCGSSLYFLNYSSMNYNQYSEIRQLTTDTLSFWANTDAIFQGGFAIGSGIFTGVNFYLQKRFSVGVEFSSALLYYKLGGQYYLKNVYQSIPNPPVTLPEATYSSSFKGLQFSKIFASFNISFWL